MTKITPLLIIVLLLINSCSIKESDANIIVSDTIDFYQSDSLLNFSFRVFNSGNTELLIDSIAANCSCTAIKIDKTQINKMDTAIVKGAILNKNMESRVSAIIVIKSNSLKQLFSKELIFVKQEGNFYQLFK